MTEQDFQLAEMLASGQATIELTPNEQDGNTTITLRVGDVEVGAFENANRALRELSRLRELPIRKVKRLASALDALEDNGELLQVSKDCLRPTDWDFLQSYLSAPAEAKATFLGQLTDRAVLQNLVRDTDPYQQSSLYLLLESAFAEGYTHFLFTSQTPNEDFGDFSEENTNENCLQGMRCPACGSFERFSILTQKMVVWEDDGSDDNGGDSSFDETSACQCETCFHRSRVEAFQEPET